MSISQIRFKTEKFRAIHSADILLNGITVVAGENSCGKSTLSKLLYCFYKSALNFESLVYNELNPKLENIRRFLDIVISEMHSISSKRNFADSFSEFHEIRTKNGEVNEEILEKWVNLIERIANTYNSLPKFFGKDIDYSRENERLKYIIKDFIEDDIQIENEVPFEKIILYIRKHFSEAIEKIRSRPTSLFLKELASIYSETDMPGTFDVYEFEKELVSLKKPNLSIPYLIQNTLYIDTPMIFGVMDFQDDLFRTLTKKGKSTNITISNIISSEIINGNTALNDSPYSSNDFIYRRNDGSIFHLIDCATGIKAFAILQILLNNGSLTDKTLLIIDEPESNLHPQWIIEYARIIVLLNKEIGVNFFIASHNPDMVSAIKYISEKEGVAGGLNFYIAEKDNVTYTYDFKHLGTDIEPIFHSFNISIDRINQYGA